MIEKIVIDTLVDFGIDVIYLGFYQSDSTVEIAVTEEKSDRYYYITSHNPKELECIEVIK